MCNVNPKVLYTALLSQKAFHELRPAINTSQNANAEGKYKSDWCGPCIKGKKLCGGVCVKKSSSKTSSSVAGPLTGNKFRVSSLTTNICPLAQGPKVLTADRGAHVTTNTGNALERCIVAIQVEIQDRRVVALVVADTL